ncbi:MAG: TIGR03885 family FMN-dependent LLM class oxidoreductase [Chloroflexota bacterium]|nr:TIGR03885 family FMN-dependent LLM class oxidoreductase [Chloroflexota bacterium]
MTIIGYHASHEQFSPAELLEYVEAAERAGFEAAMCSDHFHPWTPDQGNSGFAWSWLGAALQATQLSFGTVTTPGYRYHPAVLAQAAATLASMYEGRFWLAVGSGEALNERVTGAHWPPKSERNARLLECVEVMRALWDGETVTHYGRVTVEQATLYTRPAARPALFGAALTPETARWMGGWADGLITTAQPVAKLEQMVEAFRVDGAGKPLVMQVQLCLADSDDAARQTARQRWPLAPLASDVLAELRLPEQFAATTHSVDEKSIGQHVVAYSDPRRLVEQLSEYVELGFERIYIHHVGPDQRAFIEKFGELVLPELRTVAAGGT